MMMMMMDLITSANDSCIVVGFCDYHRNINDMDLEGRHNVASVVLTPRVSETNTLSRPYAAGNFSSFAVTALENISARASLFGMFGMHTARDRRQRETAAISESTNNKGSCRRSERNDRERELV